MFGVRRDPLWRAQPAPPLPQSRILEKRAGIGLSRRWAPEDTGCLKSIRCNALLRNGFHGGPNMDLSPDLSRRGAADFLSRQFVV